MRKTIDRRSVEFGRRSEFLEKAARSLLVQLERAEIERRDIEIINRHADRLNEEAEDVLAYQEPV